MSSQYWTLDDNYATTMRVLVVDSTESGRTFLRSLVDSIEHFEVTAEASSVESARQEISRLAPDLILMTVALPDLSRLELIRTIDTHTSVIVVTPHTQIALPAFEAGAIDCLVKPVRQQRICDSMLRAKRRIAECRMASLAMRIAGEARTISRVTSGTELSRESVRYSNQLKIRVRRRIFWLSVADIHWVQGASQYSRVHASSGEYLLARSLSALEWELDPKHFFRVHRSAIVNAAYVREIRTSGEGRYNIHLHNGPVLPMGRSRKELLGKLMQSVGDTARAIA